MEYAVDLLKWELADALESGTATDDYVSGIREAIMLLNRVMFHRKITSSDPNNEFYGKAQGD